ncbi:hypothetical protein DOTSEDRAFT_38564 [Dothistroma septosporum NZE10]|uniref:Uncharacterized protein n=1 Tax=Dothistroma septosporum (strain NZE10 / CBS 128990) TaxID=675120 RepID=M2Y234_DOTSN|nr:hypothetical protein DOTSEDRAFT_38564 [Dothistroma septosporum NZE10]
MAAHGLRLGEGMPNGAASLARVCKVGYALQLGSSRIPLFANVAADRARQTIVCEEDASLTATALRKDLQADVSPCPVLGQAARSGTSEHKHEVHTRKMFTRSTNDVVRRFAVAATATDSSWLCIIPKLFLSSITRADWSLCRYSARAWNGGLASGCSCDAAASLQGPKAYTTQADMGKETDRTSLWHKDSPATLEDCKRTRDCRQI